jgi:hypothetical protein
MRALVLRVCVPAFPGIICTSELESKTSDYILNLGGGFSIDAEFVGNEVSNSSVW